mgnify:CR=1 FL=1
MLIKIRVKDHVGNERKESRASDETTSLSLETKSTNHNSKAF